MTFQPQFGTRSEETFSSTSGAIFNNQALQDIVGGYVTLVSPRTGTSYVTRNWIEVEEWSFRDPLYNPTYVAQKFEIRTGVASINQQATQTGQNTLHPHGSVWVTYTDYPQYNATAGAYSGQIQECLYLGGTGSTQYTGYAQNIDNGNQTFTIEFDVASILSYSGLSGLAGFGTGQTNVSGLSPLTGILSHGVLIQTSANWDYIECSPYGIRSLNHPELAIPVNLLNLTRVRIGVRDSDLFLSTEDGRAIYAIGKFDVGHTLGSARPFITFGAPPIGRVNAGYDDVSPLSGQSIDGFYGYNVWDNIKILTGDIAINSSTQSPNYSTGTVSMRSAAFDPNVAISKYVNAVIRYRPSNGGTTTVFPEYSGLTGWVVYEAITIPQTGNEIYSDLSNMPVFTYPRADFGTDYLSNPIRFRIDQRSYDGTQLPPAIDSIEVTADKDKYQIDLLPDWKPDNTTMKVQIGVVTGTFYTDDPVPESWSSLLINIPTGEKKLATGVHFRDETVYNHAVHVIDGTGQIIKGGLWGTCFQNYTVGTWAAQSGSDAYSFFGLEAVSNGFPNPLFEEAFRQVVNTESRFVTGLTDGYLAEHTQIPTYYTGLFKIDYLQNEVYRPNNQAARHRLAAYLGHTTYPSTDYVQGVKVYPTTQTHNGTAGVEAVVPSGIATGNLSVSFDIEIPYGSGVQIYLSGEGITQRSFIIPGDYARTYVPIELTATSTKDTALNIGFCVPANYPGDLYEFNIDNLIVAPVEHSQLMVTGITAVRHLSGVQVQQGNPGAITAAGYRTATVFSTRLFLDAYPVVNSGVIAKFYGDNGEGLELFVDSNGLLTALVDVEENAWADAGNPEPFVNVDVPQFSITSEKKVPVGRWSSIGFMHDVHCYDKLAGSNESGEVPSLFASTNRVYLTIDGQPVASKDVMTGWRTYGTFDSAPYTSYVDLTGSVTAFFSSGLMCRMDGISLLRPPVDEVEAALAIKASRNYSPYFVPDIFFKANVPSGVSNLVYQTSYTGFTYSNDVFVGSCYNFSTPGIDCWDHGQIRNHLVYKGTPVKEDTAPYSGRTSIRLKTGVVGVAGYSSSIERIWSPTGQIDVATSWSGYLNQGAISIAGWVYPRSTGCFFTISEDGTTTGNRFEVCVDGSNALVLNKYNSSSNTLAFITTGQTFTLDAWNYFGLRIDQSTAKGFFHTGNTSTGVITTYFTDQEGQSSSTYYLTGVEYGIKYQGRFGSASTSEMRFGDAIDANFFNWTIFFPTTGTNTLVEKAEEFSSDDSKGGRYQTFMEGKNVYTGDVVWDQFYLGHVILGPSTAKNRFFSVAALNTYDQVPKLNGIVIYDNKPFKEVETYAVRYNTSIIENVFGATDSPMRVGNNVPKTAINLARFSSPALTVPGSINTIDLADRNVHNLLTYKQGGYLIQKTSIAPSVLTGFNGINSAPYSGRADVTYSGQILSSDVDVTTLSITSNDRGYAGYYYYLIGRGDKGVKILNADPHYTGEVTEYTTGLLTDSYIANLEKVRSSISFRDRQGKVIDDLIPVEIYTSPYTPDQFSDFITSGNSINLDNIGLQSTGHLLPDGVFSTILITNTNSFDGETVFVHYDSYDYISQESILGYKEIVNPQPIFRERHPLETTSIGKFDVNLSNNNYYDLVIYGMVSGYSGKL